AALLARAFSGACPEVPARRGRPGGARRMGKRQLKLLCFGLGYVATALTQALAPRGFAIAGTHRNDAAMAAPGNAAYLFDGTRPIAAEAFDGVSHLLVSIPPGEEGDP